MRKSAISGSHIRAGRRYEELDMVIATRDSQKLTTNKFQLETLVRLS